MKWAGLLCRLAAGPVVGAQAARGPEWFSWSGGGGGCGRPGDQGVWTSFQGLYGAKGRVWCRLRPAQMRVLESSRGGGCGWENWSGEKGDGQMSKQSAGLEEVGPMRGEEVGLSIPGLAPRPWGWHQWPHAPPPTPTGFRVSWPPAQRLGNFLSSLLAGRRPVLPEAPDSTFSEPDSGSAGFSSPLSTPW